MTCRKNSVYGASATQEVVDRYGDYVEVMLDLSVEPNRGRHEPAMKIIDNLWPSGSWGLNSAKGRSEGVSGR
jgi:hypothetical protein